MQWKLHCMTSQVSKEHAVPLCPPNTIFGSLWQLQAEEAQSLGAHLGLTVSGGKDARGGPAVSVPSAGTLTDWIQSITERAFKVTLPRKNCPSRSS